MRLSHRYISFSIASITLLMVFAASAAPIPLYNLYHQLYDVTYQQLALTSVVYFIGAVSALIFFGRLSNHIGRKPLALLVMTLAGSACLLFTIVESAFPLILGRVSTGYCLWAGFKRHKCISCRYRPARKTLVAIRIGE